MIFDPLTNALYDDTGKFLKTVFCPLSLRPEQLHEFRSTDRVRYCSLCRKDVMSLDNLSDDEVKNAVASDPSLCVFATPGARNIRFLSQSSGFRIGNPEGLPVIISLRSLPTMQLAAGSGFRLVFRDVGQAPSFGESKYIVYQDSITGRIWWSGDLRDGFPTPQLDGTRHDYRLIRNWFYARSDRPFPLGAYAVAPSITPGQRVYIEDVLEDISVKWWNQGNSHRLTSCFAAWNGSDLQLDVPEQGPAVLG